MKCTPGSPPERRGGRIGSIRKSLATESSRRALVPESAVDRIALVGNPDDLPDAFFQALAGLLLAGAGEEESDGCDANGGDSESQRTTIPIGGILEKVS